MGRLIERGDIRWYVFKKPDKRRPVLILTRNPAIGFLGEITVAPITRTIRDIPTEVIAGHEEGLSSECAINLDHLQTVSRGKIGTLIGHLSDTKMQQVKQGLLFALGFDT